MLLCQRIADKKGQQILEYMLVVTAVVTVLVFFITPNGFFKRSVEGALTSPANMLQNRGSGDISF